MIVRRIVIRIIRRITIRNNNETKIRITLYVLCIMHRKCSTNPTKY